MNFKNKDISSLRLVFRELVFPFWTRSENRWRARGLLALTAALIFAMVYSLVLMNTWNQAFYDSIQRLDRPEFVRQLWRFFFIALAYALATAFKFYTLQSLALLWRTWMTEKNLNRWLSDKNYYQWQLEPHGNDNPDQRLSEDIYEFSDLSLEISEKIFREAITFVSFIGILWGLSGSLNFAFLGWNVELHRYLVVICLAYAVVGTWIVHLIGHPLASLHFYQQRFEADFRYFLVRLRENGEGIALASGEPAEKRKLASKFGEIAANFKQVISKQRDVILATNVYNQIAYIFPFVVASSKVFTREITLGRLFQISSAFGQVQGSVSVFIGLYARIARWYSVVIRLGGFLESLSVNEELRRKSPATQIAVSPNRSAHASAVSLRTPAGKVLSNGITFDLTGSEGLLVTANSGVGKSTLVRSLTGLWPYFDGNVEMPQASDRLVLQQNPYFPVGTLRGALAYPLDETAFETEDYFASLVHVELAALAPHLNAEDNWSQRLSSGERQRLSLARAFLQKPKLLILDEATSALSDTAEAAIYDKLTKHLPDLKIMTLAPTGSNLAARHKSAISLEPAE